MPIFVAVADRAHRLILDIHREQAAQLLFLPSPGKLPNDATISLSALDEKAVRSVQFVVGEPRLEVSVLQPPDRVHRRVGDVHRAVFADRDVVQEDRALRGIALDDLARCDVDLDKLVDVGDVERAIMQRHSGRRVEALDPDFVLIVPSGLSLAM